MYLTTGFNQISQKQKNIESSLKHFSSYLRRHLNHQTTIQAIAAFELNAPCVKSLEAQVLQVLLNDL